MNNVEQVEKILADWREEQDRGGLSTPEDVIAQHPELASQLRARFALLDALAEAVEPDPTMPRVIGEYRIVRELGRGGMGVVYEAVQAALQRRVALKVLSPSISSVGQAVKRFQREARAAARLHHTNIVPIHDMGQHAGNWFYAMDLVEGRTLSDVIADMRHASQSEEHLAKASLGVTVSVDTASFGGTGTGGRSYYARLAEMFADVAEALQLAHQEGIVHRDIKPANLLLDGNGLLKIVDFGLARFADDNLAMTMTGDLLATPLYMSPEQALAKRITIDHRTDIYSLGATMYEALTFRPPFDADNLQDLCSQIITKDPALPRRANRRIPKDLETVVLKAMDKDRDKRYQTAREFARDLRLFAEGGAIRARRIGLAGRGWRKVKRHKVRSSLAAAALLLGVVGAMLLLRVRADAARKEERDYALLCVRGLRQEAVSGNESFVFGQRNEEAHGLFSEAIELLPDRPEAYLGRALVGGADAESRFGDLEESRARGLSLRAYHLARAEVFRVAGKPDEAEEERKLAAPLHAETPLDFLLEGRLLLARGEFDRATDVLTRTIDKATDDSPVRMLAFNSRSSAHSGRRDFDAALADALGARAAGDTSDITGVFIAVMWERVGRLEKSESEFGALLADVASENSERRWEEFCRACNASGRLEYRARATEQAIDAMPESGVLAAQRALVLYALGRREDALQMADRAVRLSPNDWNTHRARTVALQGLGRAQDALTELEYCLRLAPDKSKSWYHHARGQVLYTTGRLAEAAAANDRALAQWPYHYPYLQQRAEILVASGRFDESVVWAQKAADVAPSRSAVRWTLASALAYSGRRDEALAQCERGLALGPSPRWQALLLASRGSLLCDRGRLDEALDDCEGAVRLAPDKAFVQQQYGYVLFHAKRFEDALAAVEQAIAKQPHVRSVHELKGSALRSLGRLDEALRAIDRAIAIGGVGLGPAHVNRAACLYELGRFEEALNASDTAIALDPKRAGSRWSRAVALMQLKRYRDALAECERALAIEPGLLGAHELRVQLLTSGPTADTKKGLAAAREYVELAPDRWTGHGNYGILLKLAGRYEDALREFTRALELRQEPLLYHNQSVVLMRLRRFEDALVALESAIKLKPKWPPLHNNRGVVLQELGRLEEAYAAFEKAVALGHPDHNLANELAWRRATTTDPKLRDPERAVALARRALSMAPDNGAYYNTLGVALFRVGKWKEALGALDRSQRSAKVGDAWDWFFMAMAKHNLGHKDARESFDKAVAWMEENKPDDKELKRLRAEAEEVLGIKAK